ncbi:MAG: CocE/NonD family hydrolase C-terminal non-catalytic domain-containing protein [Actinomycetota bacterium]
MRHRHLLGLLAAASLVGSLLVSPAAHAVACAANSATPFAGIPGASLSPSDFLSKDGVRYTMWRGTVPSFDGLPLSVDVTLPCDASGPLPLVSMNHGWTDDKTIWEETGRSDTVSSEFRRGSNAHWNNIWFASRGYAVLTYTMRGWHDSCGPQSPGAIPYVAPSVECQSYKYWIHTGDQRWEVRDTQWLTGALVASGVADATKLAITGGSFGGGNTIQNAFLRDRIRCGADAQITGVDACAGKADGEFAPWTTPDGTEPLRWTVAVPLYTWFDFIETVAPNGRNSDGESVPDGDHADPVGVPIQSYVTAVWAAAHPLGNGYAPAPGVDPTADTTTATARMLAGNPFPAEDPVLANAIEQYGTYKSARGIPVDGLIPIFWVQGETDPLLTAFHALQAANTLRDYDPAYPIKLFFGDFGHDYAAERIDEWDAAHEAMNAFLDYYLKGVGPAPSFDVTAAITRCLNHDAPMELVTAPTWSGLHPTVATWTSTEAQTTTTAGPSRVGILTDPVTQAAITQNPQSYRGCRKIDSSIADPNAATYVFPVTDDVTMLGAPVVDVDFTTTAPDTTLAARLWDVDPVSGQQALVTRGVYRSLDGPSAGLKARFQLAPNGYRWLAGHSIKLEVTSNDQPYYQPNNIPGVVAISSTTLTLPTR